jgi:hypothetical protein
MPLIASLVDPTFRLFTAAEVTAQYLSLILLVVGLIDYFTVRGNPRRAVRYRGMITGSAAALVAIIGLSAFYDLVAFVMSGSGFLPPSWPYESAGSAGLLPIAQGCLGDAVVPRSRVLFTGRCARSGGNASRTDMDPWLSGNHVETRDHRCLDGRAPVHSRRWCFWDLTARL